MKKRLFSLVLILALLVPTAMLAEGVTLTLTHSPKEWRSLTSVDLIATIISDKPLDFLGFLRAAKDSELLDEEKGLKVPDSFNFRDFYDLSYTRKLDNTLLEDGTYSNVAKYTTDRNGLYVFVARDVDGNFNMAMEDVDNLWRYESQMQGTRNGLGYHLIRGK
jgi:hypothetical protein